MARILLIEDSPTEAAVMVQLLERNGHQVTTAANAEDGIASAKLDKPDLVLMDIEMPVLDGIAATRAIRQLPGHAATPIVAMTANAFAEDKARCLDAGMSDFIAKPVDPDLLFAMLDRWLNDQESA